MKARRIIAIILWVIAACGLIALLSGQVDAMNSLPQICIFSIIALFLFFGKGKSKKEKAKIKNVRLSTVAVKHFTGLPLAEGIGCVIRHDPNGFAFISGGNTFNLPNNKITDICIKTDADIRKQYVSSVGGAVGGAVLFGPIGAMIGGRAKEKKTTEFNRYLIFTYLKEEEITYVCFEIYGTAVLMRVQHWINEFRQSPHAQGASVTL